MFTKIEFYSFFTLFHGDSGAAAPAPSKVRGRVGPAGGAAKKGKTLGGQFKDSLNNLMATLNATNPSFVRTVRFKTKIKALKIFGVEVRVFSVIEESSDGMLYASAYNSQICSFYFYYLFSHPPPPLFFLHHR